MENPRFGGTYSLYQIPLDTRMVHRVRVRRLRVQEDTVTLLREFFGRDR